MRQGQQNRRGRGRNNNRKSQNPLTRSFESAGPDVKIRGTPSHIAEKYMTLARDALSSGDPVLAENYMQHAEHYNRIIMSFREQQISQGGDPYAGGQIARGPGMPGDPLDVDEFGDEEGDEFSEGRAQGQPDIGAMPQPGCRARDPVTIRVRATTRASSRATTTGSTTISIAATITASTTISATIGAKTASTGTIAVNATWAMTIARSVMTVASVRTIAETGPSVRSTASPMATAITVGHAMTVAPVTTGVCVKTVALVTIAARAKIASCGMTGPRVKSAPCAKTVLCSRSRL